MSSSSGKGGIGKGSTRTAGEGKTPLGVPIPGHANHQMFTGPDMDSEPSDPEWRPPITNITLETTAPASVKPDSGEACLVLLYPPGPYMGRRFPLTGSKLILGRDRSCNIQIDRDSVSRRHARFSCREDGWHLQDLESTNGSSVNDVSVTEAPLRDGDFIKIGGVIFKFLAGAGIEASYHDELYQLTIKDALTSAHNKRHFLELFERELFRCARYGRPLSLLLIDVDHFKSFNDKHGHLTGDHLLRELARRIRERVHPEALLARYGGGEFAVVLPEIDLTDARTFGEQVRRLVAEHPFEYEGQTFEISVSIGVACVEGGAIDVPKFIKVAKDNLHRAKREGRNRVVAGTREWHRWRADHAFRSQVSGRAAVAALSLLARDQILAGSSGVAYVDDLEGLLYARLREHQQAEQALSFGALEGGSKLLVASEGRNPTHRLRAVVFEALRRCAEERPEARFAIGPIVLAREGARAIEDAVAGLDDEIATLENGHYLPQPVAVTLRALEGTAGGLAKSILGLGEALLQWLALCAAAELGVRGGAARTAAALRRSLDGGATPERWHEVLAIGIEELLEAGAVHDPAWRACFGDEAARGELFAWLSSFVDLRGAFARGATASDEHIARKIVDEAAPRLRQLIKRQLRAVLALIPAEIKLVGFEGELQSYRMTRLIGDGMAAPVAMYSRRRMNPGLWLCDPSADRAIPLEPYFIRDTCPKCGARELFLLARLDELEFRNPASGHVLRKPVDEIPLSPEAREHLLELVGPASAGARAPTAREDAEAPAPRPRALEVGGAAAGRDPARPGPAARKHTILFLAANPTGTDRFALDREARAIQVELERSGFRDRFELVTRWAAEPLDLLRELRRLRPTVIHFSGHGRGGAHGEHRPGEAPPEVRPGAHGPHGPHGDAPGHGLYFQGPDGRPQLVSTSALEETFGAAGASVKLVVLSACYSEVQAEALLSHVDCVVGVGGAVRDDAARSSRSASTAASASASRSRWPTSRAAPRSASRGCATPIARSSRSAPASTPPGSSWPLSARGTHEHPRGHRRWSGLLRQLEADRDVEGERLQRAAEGAASGPRDGLVRDLREVRRAPHRAVRRLRHRHDAAELDAERPRGLRRLLLRRLERHLAHLLLQLRQVAAPELARHRARARVRAGLHDRADQLEALRRRGHGHLGAVAGDPLRRDPERGLRVHRIEPEIRQLEIGALDADPLQRLDEHLLLLLHGGGRLAGPRALGGDRHREVRAVRADLEHGGPGHGHGAGLVELHRGDGDDLRRDAIGARRDREQRGREDEASERVLQHAFYLSRSPDGRRHARHARPTTCLHTPYEAAAGPGPAAARAPPASGRAASSNTNRRGARRAVERLWREPVGAYPLIASEPLDGDERPRSCLRASRNTSATAT